MHTYMSCDEAVELGNALLDAAELAASQGKPFYANKVINCYVAMSECDGKTHIKVLPPPIPLHGGGDSYNKSDAPVNSDASDIKKPLRRGAA